MRTVTVALLAVSVGGAARVSAQAPVVIPAAAAQIAAAITPLPEELKSGAAVLGYQVAGKLV